jgi:hypothetical protein
MLHQTSKDVRKMISHAIRARKLTHTQTQTTCHQKRLYCGSTLAKISSLNFKITWPLLSAKEGNFLRKPSEIITQLKNFI